ncbi:hypothetical protein EDB81DRAFT_879885 [Dactylonectria macrodidyma]|uniref:Uncharacterized protein n=1 Tax=Dactylonectria macrodidyma TaxID=307937 RepID=A0A9P9FEY3_9HYPO|nr:hypothetical protein EDB81DRAFT_879885 [Dactylonectria macrodidyma]
MAARQAASLARTLISWIHGSEMCRPQTPAMDVVVPGDRDVYYAFSVLLIFIIIQSKAPAGAPVRKASSAAGLEARQIPARSPLARQRESGNDQIEKQVQSTEHQTRRA